MNVLSELLQRTILEKGIGALRGMGLKISLSSRFGRQYATVYVVDRKDNVLMTWYEGEFCPGDSITLLDLDEPFKIEVSAS